MNELSKQILSGAISKEDEIKIDLDKNNNFLFKNNKAIKDEVLGSTV